MKVGHIKSYEKLLLFQMENRLMLILFCISVTILLLLLASCYWVNLRTWITTWILSTREEKVSLTRSKVYNANGYLVGNSIPYNVI